MDFYRALTRSTNIDIAMLASRALIAAGSCVARLVVNTNIALDEQARRYRLFITLETPA